MTLDEALSEAVLGARLTAAHMQPGSYLCHSFSRGYLRCWPVDRPEDEPQRTQCDWRTSELDAAADWRILEYDEQYPPVVKNAWGKPLKPATQNTPEYVEAVKELIGEKPKAEFCGVCDFTKDKCKCKAAPKLSEQLKPIEPTVGWGNPLLKKEPNKWGK